MRLRIPTYGTKFKLQLIECVSVDNTVICHCSVIDDHSRVVIHGNPASDYINANYIHVSFFILRSIHLINISITCVCAAEIVTSKIANVSTSS